MVLGVPICTKFFAELQAQHIDNWTLVALGVSVFIIYTVDHIIDGYKWKEKSYALRHLLHYKYASKLIVILLFLGCFEVFLLIYKLPTPSIQFGVIVSCMVLIYLILHYVKAGIFNRTLIGKEMVISLVVSACFVYLPRFHAEFSIAVSDLLFFVMAVMLNFGNLMLFSMYDLEIDQKAEFKAHRSQNTKKHLKLISLVALLISAVLMILLYWNYMLNTFGFLVLAFMVITLLITWRYQFFFEKNERYRLAGDLIYVYPIIYLALA